MLKNILISGLLSTLLSAQNSPEKLISFDIFLQKAIKSSTYLESSALAVQQTEYSGSVLTRYENPTLELEYANFTPDIGSSDNGYKVNYSQPIRLWNVSDTKAKLSRDMTNNANAEYSQKRMVFIRDVSLYYVSYSEQNKLLSLANEELKIAKSIFDISKARYDSGTISRGVMLQAKIDFESAEIANESLLLAIDESYYNLLRFVGINEEIKLDTSHTFVSTITNDTTNNPNIKLLKSEQNKALSEVEVNSNSVEWMSTYVEYEDEPEQNIVRIGVNFPLAIFNTKSEEKEIAILQASRSELLIDNEIKRLSVETKRLQKERLSLEKLRIKNGEMLQSELELLKMFQNSYKIANINLLQLQDIKNKLISTKRNLIKINTALNKNAITMNYMQGIHND